MEQYDETADVRTCGNSVQGETGRTRVDSFSEIVLKSLTIGEHMVIWRRRQGQTQREAAASMGIPRNRYGELEREENAGKASALPQLDELKSYEKCFILRRRRGWTIPIAADKIGVSRYWYNQMELGNAVPDTLVAFWVKNEG